MSRRCGVADEVLASSNILWDAVAVVAHPATAWHSTVGCTHPCGATAVGLLGAAAF
jgi:hypothetical protein